MILFGVQVPILELLVILCILIVIYLVVLEFEFRQQRKIAQEFDSEEAKLSKEVRELKEEIKEVKEITRNMGVE